MNIQQLEYALALQKHKNYSRAAKHLGISQPGLSLQIKNLETELGIMIFDRSKKPLTPTVEGEVFLGRASTLLNDFMQLESFAQSLSDDFTGNLKLGIIPTIAPYLVPLFVADFNTAFPDIKLSITELLTDDILRHLKDGHLDAGIIATPILTDYKFVAKPILYERFQVFVSDKHPLYKYSNIDIASISNESLYLLREGNCFRTQINNLCGLHNVECGLPTFRYESSSIEALCRIVEYKGGITFIPELATLHISRDREDMIKDISPHSPIREVSIVHMPNQNRKKILQNLVACIQENIPKHMLSSDLGSIVNIL